MVQSKGQVLRIIKLGLDQYNLSVFAFNGVPLQSSTKH